MDYLDGFQEHPEEIVAKGKLLNAILTYVPVSVYPAKLFADFIFSILRIFHFKHIYPGIH